MALGEEDFLSIGFRVFVFIVAGLPFSALLICVGLSILLHYDEATRTHCHVDNWLPSISAAVSTYAPEMYIWRLFIAVHSGPRIIFAFAERNYLMYSPLRPHGKSYFFKLACRIACGLNLLENFCLILLTSVSSIENHEYHKVFFIGFAITATLHMFLSTYLFDYSGRRRASQVGEKSYEYKILACSISVISIFLAMYLYWRHNAYCEPGIYTLFALTEYCIVLANIFFHSMAWYDFHGKRISLSSAGDQYGYQLLPAHVNKNT